jgi:hypothetical protein
MAMAKQSDEQAVSTLKQPRMNYLSLLTLVLKRFILLFCEKIKKE